VQVVTFARSTTLEFPSAFSLHELPKFVPRDSVPTEKVWMTPPTERKWLHRSPFALPCFNASGAIFSTERTAPKPHLADSEQAIFFIFVEHRFTVLLSPKPVARVPFLVFMARMRNTARPLDHRGFFSIVFVLSSSCYRRFLLT